MTEHGLGDCSGPHCPHMQGRSHPSVPGEVPRLLPPPLLITLPKTSSFSYKYRYTAWRNVPERYLAGTREASRRLSVTDGRRCRIFKKNNPTAYQSRLAVEPSQNLNSKPILSFNQSWRTVGRSGVIEGLATSWKRADNFRQANDAMRVFVTHSFPPRFSASAAGEVLISLSFVGDCYLASYIFNPMRKTKRGMVFLCPPSVSRHYLCPFPVFSISPLIARRSSPPPLPFACPMLMSATLI